MSRKIAMTCGCAALVALCNTRSHAAKPAECDALAAQFQKALAAAPGRCKADQDCAAYPTFIDCGGFTDRASAKKLSKIHARYTARGCGYSRVRCAKQRPQVASCDKGRCAGKTDPCYMLTEEFYGVLQAASGRCRTDADCARYPAVVDCDGVTDKATAAKLAPLGAQFRKLRCKRARCAFRKVLPRPTCREGACKAR